MLFRSKLLQQEEEGHEGIKAATNLKGAIVTILIADLVMSVDNVLAVAATAAGHLGLLAFGLVLSMGILMFMGSVVAELINKAWWLAYIGAGVIAWTAAEMILKDSIVRSRISVDGASAYLISGAATLVTLAIAHWWRRREAD